MAERESESRHGAPPPGLPETALGDRDIDLKSVFLFAGGLAAATVVVFVVVWAMSLQIKESLVASDPEPSPLPEASFPSVAPAPRLEEAPARELAELRAREDALLQGWGWVDKERGVARIPIERAIDIAAEKGLPAPPPLPVEPPPVPPAGGTK